MTNVATVGERKRQTAMPTSTRPAGSVRGRHQHRLVIRPEIRRETATFHIQTPYPGTRLYARTEAAGRILTRDWDLYDTRHVVYRPARLTPEQLKHGYDWAYREFYRWSSIARGSQATGPSSIS